VVTVADKVARVWETATGKPVSEPMRHDAEVIGAVFSSDGGRVATVTTNNAVRIWEAATGKAVGPSVEHPEFGKASRGMWTSPWYPKGMKFYDWKDLNWLVLSCDGRWLLTCSGNAAHLWEAATGKPLGLPMRHDSKVWSAAVSPDNRWVVTSSDDKTARLWEAGTGKPVGEPMRHNDAVKWAVFSPDGSRILTSERIWEVPTGKPVSGAMVNGVSHPEAFPLDGRFVTTVSGEMATKSEENFAVHIARVWDTESGTPVCDFVPIKLTDLSKCEIPSLRDRFFFDVDFLWPFVKPGSAAGAADLAELIQLGEYAGGIVLDEKTGGPPPAFLR
jgi:WD40 repeat protein